MMDYLSYFYGGLLFGTATLAIGMILAIRGVRRGEKLGRAIPLPMLLQLGFLVLVFLGVSFDLAFVTRFKMSRSALQDAAEDIQRGHRRVTPRLGRPF